MTNLPQPLLSGARRDYGIEHVLKALGADAGLRPGERSLGAFILPPWQRPLAWEEHRKRRFVEGVFLGLGTGYYVQHAWDWDEGGSKPMAGWLLDGQQRISSLIDFAEGRLAIFDGVRFADLDVATARRRFLGVVFPCVELAYQADELRLREVYDRLNFGGMAHTETDRVLAAECPPLRERARQ